MRVLIVEDDLALGLFLQKGLISEGHEVEWIGDGEAALARLRQTNFYLSAELVQLVRSRL